MPQPLARALARQHRAAQDAWAVCDFPGRASSVLFGVFDGHGPHGRRVSLALASQLPKALAASREWQARRQPALSCAAPPALPQGGAGWTAAPTGMAHRPAGRSSLLCRRGAEPGLPVTAPCSTLTAGRPAAAGSYKVQHSAWRSRHS